jgi:3-deoxy-D-manno-octulosonic-acid transferase
MCVVYSFLAKIIACPCPLQRSFLQIFMRNFLWIYKKITSASEAVLKQLLHRRLSQRKEIKERLSERMGTPSLLRPQGPLIWLHGASVGEAQSLITLMKVLVQHLPHVHVLVTTGTVTSAQFLQDRLPERCFHQFIPLDHPEWMRSFLDHWSPTLILWAESELWPNILTLIKKRHIPIALINARLSRSSFSRWMRFKNTASEILSCFSVILTQTKLDQDHFLKLGARSVRITGNIKYAADPLPVLENDLREFKKAINERPVWVYASTHDNEEELACVSHLKLKEQFPNLLTLIAPRHPSRTWDIEKTCQKFNLQIRLRDDQINRHIPSQHDDVFIFNTIGEMGLVYRLSQISCIGRSFSQDGGGGHNPLEAAFLKSAVLHGPQVQNLQSIYEDMQSEQACFALNHPDQIPEILAYLFTHKDELEKAQNRAYQFAKSRSSVLKTILEELEHIFLLSHLPPPKIKENPHENA